MYLSPKGKVWESGPQSESESPKSRSITNIEGQKTDITAEGERVNLPFVYICWSFQVAQW